MWGGAYVVCMCVEAATYGRWGSVLGRLLCALRQWSVVNTPLGGREFFLHWYRDDAVQFARFGRRDAYAPGVACGCQCSVRGRIVGTRWMAAVSQVHTRADMYVWIGMYPAARMTLSPRLAGSTPPGRARAQYKVRRVRPEMSSQFPSSSRFRETTRVGGADASLYVRTYVCMYAGKK